MRDACSYYYVDYEEIERFLVESGARRVLVQAPNGLKSLVPCILERFGGKYEFYLSGSHAYGGCDLAIDEAERLGADALIHVGHSEYPQLAWRPRIPVLYVPAYYSWKPPSSLVDRVVETLRGDGISSIGLVSTIQHVNSLDELLEAIESRGLEARIGSPSSPSMRRGQVIGCDYSAAQSIAGAVEAFLVVAGGSFHAIGLALALSSDKRVYGVDPYTNSAWNASTSARKVYAKRQYLMSELRHKGFKSAGIIVGAKPGQYRLELAKRVGELSREMGVEHYYLATNELSEEVLVNLDSSLSLDLYVVTSCPRLPIDDLSGFYKPVLTPGEYFAVLRGEAEKYVFPW